MTRYGDRPASRYEEGSIDIQAEGELPLPAVVGPRARDLRRGVQRLPADRPLLVHRPAAVLLRPLRHSRAAMADAVASTLDYLDSRDLLSRLPDAWSAVLGELVVPLRHYESGRPDGVVRHRPLRLRHDDHPVRRLRRVRPDRQRAGAQPGRHRPRRWHGRAAGDAKTRWVEDAALQGLRRYVEELFLEKDWGKALVASRRRWTASLLAVLHAPRRRRDRPGAPARTAWSRSTSPRGSRTSASGSTPCTRPGPPTPRPVPPTRHCSPRRPPRPSTPRSPR